jgi:type IV pilus assembly protein PilB
MALFEIMEMDDDMRELVMKEASTACCVTTRARAGCGASARAGCSAIYDGLTTIDEVVRETLGEE